jgi:hypothetical protein
MKQIVIIFWVIVIIFVSGCTGKKGNIISDSATITTSKGTSEIVFSEYQHDFGKVAEGEKLSYIFTFENKGQGDLIINSASTSCGCTVPKYDTKPIRSGDSGKLEVVFDTSGRNGIQTKVITVKSNASTPVVLLKIIAEIVTNNNK